MPRCISSWTSFLDRFLVDFCSQLRPPDLDFSSPRCRESTNYQKSAFEVNIDFWSHFGANLASFWHEIPPKSIQKSIPRDIKKMIDFWIDFLSILAPFWKPNWEPRAAQNGPKTLPRRPQDATKTAQEQQEHTRSKFGRFLVLPASIFEVCGPILVQFWCQFWCQVCAQELWKTFHQN